MKMSNKTRKIVGALILIIGIMMQFGTAAYAENEEGPNDIIEALTADGFIYDEYEEVWMYIEYTFYGEGEYEYIHAWFDTDENIGIAFSVSYNKFGLVDECASSAIRWNSYTNEVEYVGEFEWSN